MSYRCYADKVNFSLAQEVPDGFKPDFLSPDYSGFAINVNGKYKDTPIKGWNWEGEGFDGSLCGGSEGNLSFDQGFKKDDMFVYVLNTSQYRNIGNSCIRVVANDKESLLEFAKDFGLNNKINENEIIKKWV